METRRVTKIESQKKDKNRVSIYLDGQFAFGISIDVMMLFGLASGDSLSPEDVEKILKSESAHAAKAKAMSLIAYRPRSVFEIRAKLREKQFSEDAVQKALKDLVRVGLLNDRQFAGSFVRTRLVQKPCGSRLLKQQLRQKGIDEQIIDSVIHEEFAEIEESEMVYKLAEKQKRKPGEDKRKAARRLSGFLLRRGFSWDAVKPVIDNYLNTAE